MAKMIEKKRSNPTARSPATTRNTASQRVTGNTRVPSKASSKNGAIRSVKPLPFYAEVRVLKGKGVAAECVGQTGVVVGVAKTSGASWNYSVLISARSYYLPHTALRPTGKILDRAAIYSGQSIRVSVDHAGFGTVIGR